MLPTSRYAYELGIWVILSRQSDKFLAVQWELIFWGEVNHPPAKEPNYKCWALSKPSAEAAGLDWWIKGTRRVRSSTQVKALNLGNGINASGNSKHFIPNLKTGLSTVSEIKQRQRKLWQGGRKLSFKDHRRSVPKKNTVASEVGNDSHFEACWRQSRKHWRFESPRKVLETVITDAWLFRNWP